MINQTAATPEFDPCRVEMIRALLEEDNYTFDPLRIAVRIIDIELALSGKS